MTTLQTVSRPSANRNVSDLSKAPVLVVGAGCSGLATALELARQGQPVRIIDRANAPTTESRGTGLQARTLELLSLYGVSDDIVSRANCLKGLSFFLDGEPLGGVDFTANSSRFPFSPALPQSITEGILRDRLQRAGVKVEWGLELASLQQDDEGVFAQLRHPHGLEGVATPWLVACDGSRSTVRNLLGLAFDGQSYPEGWALMDAKIDWSLTRDRIRVWRRASGGQFIAVPLKDDIWRVQIDTRDTQRDVDLPTVEDMQAALQAATGLNAQIGPPTWRANFRVGRRQVSDYRTGRVLLAGDAAHVHTPAGGQGLNMGIQDGINLGWKLALVAKGHADSRLIDSYEAERKPIAASVLELTEILARRPQALVASQDRSARDHADAVGQLSHHYRGSPLSKPLPRRPAGLNGAHCVAGDRVPDFAIGDGRLYPLLAQHGLVIVLLGNNGQWAQAAQQLRAAWAGRVQVWDLSDNPAGTGFMSDLPPQTASAMQAFVGVTCGAVVIRPDAYFGLVEPGSPAAMLPLIEDYLDSAVCLRRAAANSAH